MARVTVEDCLENVDNRFALVHVAAKRARELFKGASPVVKCRNKEVVTALREIADEQILVFKPVPVEDEKTDNKKLAS